MSASDNKDKWHNPTGEDYLCGFACMAFVMDAILEKSPNTVRKYENKTSIFLQVYATLSDHNSEKITAATDRDKEIIKANLVKTAYVDTIEKDPGNPPPLNHLINSAVLQMLAQANSEPESQESGIDAQISADIIKILQKNQSLSNALTALIRDPNVDTNAVIEKIKKDAPDLYDEIKTQYLNTVESEKYPANSYEMAYMAQNLGFDGVEIYANADDVNPQRLSSTNKDKGNFLSLFNSTAKFHWQVDKNFTRTEYVRASPRASDAQARTDAVGLEEAAEAAEAAPTDYTPEAPDTSTGSSGVEGVIEKPKTKNIDTDPEVVIPKPKPGPELEESSPPETDEEPEVAIPEHPERFHDEADAGGHFNTKVVTWARAYYALNQNNVWYPMTPGFVRSRTAQTDSNEFMMFYGQHIKELNLKGTGITRSMVRAALTAIRTQRANYPFSSLAGIIEKAITEQALKDGKASTKEEAAVLVQKLSDALYHHRLYQFSRNAFPWNASVDDSEFLSRRLNWFGMGNVPRSEIEASLEGFLMEMGADLVPDVPGNQAGKSANGEYTLRITVDDDKGGSKQIDALKIKVDNNTHRITTTMAKGIAPEDKPAVIRHIVATHAKHVQQSGSNVFDAKIGSNIFDNIRMLQLALYDYNMHLTFQNLDANGALAKMMQQIDACDCTDDEKDVMRDEVQFIIERAQTFATTIADDDYGTKRIENRKPYNGASLAKIQKQLSERSAQQVRKIFSGPSPKSTMRVTASKSKP